MQDRTDTPASALWRAAYVGDTRLVIQLLSEGVDVNVWDKWGRSALSLAAGAGHIETVRVLLEAGAWVDPHEDYDIYMTPLMDAAQNGHLHVVKYLLAHGADPTRHGGVAQMTAENYGRGQSLELDALLLKAEDEWRKSHR